MATNITETFLQEMQAKDLKIEALEESLTDLALRIEDIGWKKLIGDFDFEAGPTLEALKTFDEKLSDMAAANPLMKRGSQLRHGYVFGKGIVFTDVKPGTQTIIDKPHNRRALFTVQSYEELNLAKFTSGNVFVVYDKRDKRYTRVPLRQITGVITREDDAEEILYLKRTWSANGKEYNVWYPVNTNTTPQKSITNSAGERVPVETGKVMYHEAANKQVGWTFGIPDGLAGMSWALAYSEYLKGNADLVKAYSQFAWQIMRKTKSGTQAAAMSVSTATGEVGATAVTTGDKALTPINPSGSQVNFDNGQALASMVAASLGVSVIALLSSPGAAAGSYGAAQTLDAPTLIGMQAIQDTWALFYQTILRDTGSPKAAVEFPAIETDPTYRLLGLVAQLLAAGILHQEEAQDLARDLLDIRDPKDGVPEPAWFNIGAKTLTNSSGEEDSELPDDPNARQGNSGMVGSITQGDTNNDGRTDNIGNE